MEKEMLYPELIFTRTFNYDEYKTLVFKLADDGQTTGPEQSTERIEATKLNAQRIKRLDKTIEVNKELAAELATIDKKWNWAIIVESWCGDGAQNVPVIAKIACLNKCIDLKIILRDENPKIMDQYLTNGARAIPILICTDVLTGIVIGTWGPRPVKIASMAKEWKAKNPAAPHAEFLINLHLLYAKDKGQSVQSDLLFKIKSWKAALLQGNSPAHQ